MFPLLKRGRLNRRRSRQIEGWRFRHRPAYGRPQYILPHCLCKTARPSGGDATLRQHTLHDAMVIILLERKDRTASTEFLSDEIAQRGLYRQRKGGIAHKGQIAARARKYPQLFQIVAPQTIRLVGNRLFVYFQTTKKKSFSA